MLERQLRSREFIADEYSMAPDDFPALAQWIARIEQRPAIATARAVIFDGDRAKYLQARAKLTPQEWSTLFGDRLLAAARAD